MGENPMIPKIAPPGEFYRIMDTRASSSVPDLRKWSCNDTAEGREKGWSEALRMEELGVDTGKVPFDK